MLFPPDNVFYYLNDVYLAFPSEWTECFCTNEAYFRVCKLSYLTLMNTPFHKNMQVVNRYLINLNYILSLGFVQIFQGILSFLLFITQQIQCLLLSTMSKSHLHSKPGFYVSLLRYSPCPFQSVSQILCLQNFPWGPSACGLTISNTDIFHCEKYPISLQNPVPRRVVTNSYPKAIAEDPNKITQLIARFTAVVSCGIIITCIRSYNSVPLIFILLYCHWTKANILA